MPRSTKVMVLGAFVLILYLGLLEPIWLHAPLVALIAVRELGITWMRTAAARKGLVLAAEKAGKRKNDLADNVHLRAVGGADVPNAMWLLGRAGR